MNAITDAASMLAPPVDIDREVLVSGSLDLTSGPLKRSLTWLVSCVQEQQRQLQSLAARLRVLDNGGAGEVEASTETTSDARMSRPSASQLQTTMREELVSMQISALKSELAARPKADVVFEQQQVLIKAEVDKLTSETAHQIRNAEERLKGELASATEALHEQLLRISSEILTRFSAMDGNVAESQAAIMGLQAKEASRDATILALSSKTAETADSLATMAIQLHAATMPLAAAAEGPGASDHASAPTWPATHPGFAEVEAPPALPAAVARAPEPAPLAVAAPAASATAAAAPPVSAGVASFAAATPAEAPVQPQPEMPALDTSSLDTLALALKEEVASRATLGGVVESNHREFLVAVEFLTRRIDKVDKEVTVSASQMDRSYRQILEIATRVEDKPVDTTQPAAAPRQPSQPVVVEDKPLVLTQPAATQQQLSKPRVAEDKPQRVVVEQKPSQSIAMEVPKREDKIDLALMSQSASQQNNGGSVAQSISSGGGRLNDGESDIGMEERTPLASRTALEEVAKLVGTLSATISGLLGRMETVEDALRSARLHNEEAPSYSGDGRSDDLSARDSRHGGVLPGSAGSDDLSGRNVIAQNLVRGDGRSDDLSARDYRHGGVLPGSARSDDLSGRNVIAQNLVRGDEFGLVGNIDGRNVNRQGSFRGVASANAASAIEDDPAGTPIGGGGDLGGTGANCLVTEIPPPPVASRLPLQSETRIGRGGGSESVPPPRRSVVASSAPDDSAAYPTRVTRPSRSENKEVERLEKRVAALESQPKQSRSRRGSKDGDAVAIDVLRELELFRKLFEFVESVLPKDKSEAMRFFQKGNTERAEDQGDDAVANVLGVNVELERFRTSVEDEVRRQYEQVRHEFDNLARAIKGLQRDMEQARGKTEDLAGHLGRIEKRQEDVISNIEASWGGNDAGSEAQHRESELPRKKSFTSTVDKPPPAGDLSHLLLDQANVNGEELPFATKRALHTALESLKDDIRSWLDMLYTSMLNALQQKADANQLDEVTQRLSQVAGVATDRIAAFAKRALLGRCASCDTQIQADPTKVARPIPIALQGPWPPRLGGATNFIRQPEARKTFPAALPTDTRLPKIQDRQGGDQQFPKGKVIKNPSAPDLRPNKQQDEVSRLVG